MPLTNTLPYTVRFVSGTPAKPYGFVGERRSEGATNRDLLANFVGCVLDDDASRDDEVERREYYDELRCVLSLKARTYKRGGSPIIKTLEVQGANSQPREALSIKG